MTLGQVGTADAAVTGLLPGLVDALAAFDVPAADRVCTELAGALHDCPSPASVASATEVLAVIRRSRRFDLLRRVAELLLQTGTDAPVVSRQYAQALLDEGLISAAVAVLQDLVAAEDEEGVEARGLVGRAYKQLFLLTGPNAPGRRREFLRRAVAAYAEGARLSAGLPWLGVNAAALLLRAERDGIAIPGYPDPGERARDIATEMLSRIDAGADAFGVWGWATAVEANLALGRVEQAVTCLGRYLMDDRLGAFELGGLHRQLVDVWQLRADRVPGVLLLPPLAAMLLRKQGGALEIGARDAAASVAATSDRRDAFEKVFGADGLQTQRWFEQLLLRCRGVARIEDDYGDGWGSGFLVAGPDLHPALPPVVLVTNAHVIPGAVAAENAVVTFRGLPAADGPGARARVTRLLWSSPETDLDAALVELDQVPPGVELCPVGTRMPPLDVEPPPRVYVVGHPLGAPVVKVAVQDNHLLDYDDVRVHYRAPTEPGSSGSPVFDKMWTVVALHHAGDTAMPRLHGSGFYPANEGIRVDRIRTTLGEQMSPP